MQVRGSRGIGSAIRVIARAGTRSMQSRATLSVALLLVLAAGCHSSRQAEASSVTHSEAADSAAVAARTVKHLERTESGALRIDWAATAIEADSVRIRRVDGSEAVIYGPRQSASASGIERRSEARETATDSSAVEAVAAHHELADSAAHEEETSETAAVYKPPDMTWILWALLVIVVFLIVTKRSLKR